MSLYDVRRLLHSRMSAEVHDWASLVVYEAFPLDLLEQLEELRYWQTRSAANAPPGAVLEHVLSALRASDAKVLNCPKNGWRGGGVRTLRRLTFDVAGIGHGIPQAPNPAGQSDIYLVKALFRTVSTLPRQRWKWRSILRSKGSGQNGNAR